MQAIILAAGMGKRLKELTKNNTKCMIKVNGRTLIERMLKQLEVYGLSRIVIVIGYKGKELVDYITSLNIGTPIVYVENEIYDKTNNIYSLALAKDYLCAEDTLLMESDIIIESSAIMGLINDTRKNLALVDKYESWMDGACMEVDEEGYITNFIKGKDLDFGDKGNYYKTVNIYKLSREFSEKTYVPFLCAYEKTMGENEYYESVIKLIAMLEVRELRARKLSGELWYEIDNVQDLDIAESLFVESSESHYELIAQRYGGYWRYPKMLDFCYLVNPYFPNDRMLEEMKANFHVLMSQYPSGMRVNSLLAANCFGVKQEHIIVGNGAAELIKSLLESFEGKIGFIFPTFAEYPNRCIKERHVVFYPQNLTYGCLDIMDFFECHTIDTLVLINPDNPSGNYIRKNELFKLIRWCKARKIALIVDESFVDFADVEDMSESMTLVDEDILKLYDNLFIIKSISKTYGVPGLRLGILASGNVNVIEYIKKDLSIWNINSFGEFFLQILEKYMDDYRSSLVKMRNERKYLERCLQEIRGIYVFHSQANYVMCELKGVRSAKVCSHLLDMNILVKDLTEKINNGKQYIRIAVRTREDNIKLITALGIVIMGENG